MPTYTVQEIKSKREFNTKHGNQLVSYKIDVRGDDGFNGVAELTQKPETKAPEPGQAIEGTLDRSNPQYPPKIKKTPQGGGRPGGGKSKADQDSIERAVAYKGAVDLACASIELWPSAYNAPEGFEAIVERFFRHGLTLLQGKAPSAPAPAPAAPSGPSREELKQAYLRYINASAAIGREQEEANKILALKKTALGIDDVADATPEQQRQFIEFLTAEVA